MGCIDNMQARGMFRPFYAFVSGELCPNAQNQSKSDCVADLILVDVYRQQQFPNLWPTPYSNGKVIFYLCNHFI